jgi:hypothetical protein
MRNVKTAVRMIGTGLRARMVFCQFVKLVMDSSEWLRREDMFGREGCLVVGGLIMFSKWIVVEIGKLVWREK